MHPKEPAPTPDAKSVRRRRVCIVTYSFYECDTRVFRYGQALAGRGDDVEVLALSSGPEKPAEEIIDGCCLHRIQTRAGNEKTKLAFLLPLLRFLWRASWHIARSHRRAPFDLLHIHNIPDFLVFCAWRPKLSGARVILDIHDIVPEFFASKFRVRESHLIIRLLRLMERASAAFADHIIIANDLWLEKYASRSATPKKCSVLINFVDRSIFSPRPRTRHDDRQILLFPGGLQPHQGLDVAIRAFALIKDRLPKSEFHIYGEGSHKPILLDLVRELGIENRVHFFGWISTREIAQVMSDADLGVVPKRADSFGDEAYSTKIMEFMSVGVPVVISSTKVDRFYFNDQIVRFFESGNHEALARELFALLSDPSVRAAQVARANIYVARNNWEDRKNDYLALVDTLCTSGTN